MLGGRHSRAISDRPTNSSASKIPLSPLFPLNTKKTGVGDTRGMTNRSTPGPPRDDPSARVWPPHSKISGPSVDPPRFLHLYRFRTDSSSLYPLSPQPLPRRTKKNRGEGHPLLFTRESQITSHESRPLLSCFLVAGRRSRIAFHGIYPLVTYLSLVGAPTFLRVQRPNY